MDKRVEPFRQESGHLCTKMWRLVDKGVETCGQESGDLWTKDWILVDILVLGIQTQFIVAIVTNTVIIMQCYYDLNFQVSRQCVPPRCLSAKSRPFGPRGGCITMVKSLKI